LVAFGSMLLWQKAQAGTALNVVSSGKGWYPQNLLSFYPFLPFAFLRPAVPALLHPWFAREAFYTLARLLTLAMAAALLVFYLRRFRKNPFHLYTARVAFVWMALIATIVVVSVLALLSLTNGRVWERDHWWTFVEEARYYGLPIVLCQLGFVAYARLSHRAAWKKALVALLAFFLCLE